MRRRRRPGTDPARAPRGGARRAGRQLTVIAQDPSVTDGGAIVRSTLEVPGEDLAPGPCGYRVAVIDYDSTSGVLYTPVDLGDDGNPFEGASDDELVGSPHFHQQNVYAIVMCTLARFEFALGRRVSWSIRGHQLKIAPHAFADANAFYSESDEALMFGYFPRRDGRGTVFSCLSHDVVAHEATHAILDGLRTRYTDPSSPDQAAFHEGFADVVALLSVFSQPGVARLLVPNQPGDARGIEVARLTADDLRHGPVFGVAEQMGEEMQGARGKPLRRSLDLLPSPGRPGGADLREPHRSAIAASCSALLNSPEFREPHRRGEIFVAAILGAFFDIWAARIQRLDASGSGLVDRGAVVEAGADVANHLLTVCIRALDYTPPVDLQFSDFLAALVTADTELFQDDRKYEFRRRVHESFARFGIHPPRWCSPEGLWESWEATGNHVHYDRIHCESLQRDRDEMFRFVWENRGALAIDRNAYLEVISVRPCLRQGRDGFFLRETVAEYVEILRLRGRELEKVLGLHLPDGVSPDAEVPLYGGGTLIFDEFSRLKYHVKSRVGSKEKQQRRIDYLASCGAWDDSAGERTFAEIHLQRSAAVTRRYPRSW